MLRERVELSMDAVRAFWRWEGHDRVPSVLVSTVEWMDDDTRREADRQVLAELAGRGLLAGGGVPAQMRATFHVLARPDVEVFGWISTPQRTLGVLAAAGGGEAALVVREGDAAWLSPVKPDDVAEAVVAQLPARPPAQGRSINVCEADFARPQGEEAWNGFRPTTEPHDVRALKALLGEPVLGISQLWVAARGADGRLHQAENPVTVRDTAEGRWLTQTTASAAGRWVSATPAGPQLVTSKLHEKLRRLG
ncbi:ESX secretion-associated protein EspG [Kutzneria sp. NPDC051319]|uniref:ESX secretion-associated protein EspG n=1 Tax=Kutzneria sp. NPDC051319 TaxID=3155047 RepID=UPI003439F181